jgi:hypothetical protein
MTKKKGPDKPTTPAFNPNYPPYKPSGPQPDENDEDEHQHDEDPGKDDPWNKPKPVLPDDPETQGDEGSVPPGTKPPPPGH